MKSKITTDIKTRIVDHHVKAQAAAGKILELLEEFIYDGTPVRRDRGRAVEGLGNVITKIEGVCPDSRSFGYDTIVHQKLSAFDKFRGAPGRNTGI